LKTNWVAIESFLIFARQMRGRLPEGEPKPTISQSKRMGIVKRQGIKQSVVTYVGVLIGMVNVLFIYPAFLQEAEIGILNYVRETAAMLSLFAFLGSTELVVRFFPFFRNDEKQHQGFLFLLLMIVSMGCLLMLAGFLIFKNQIFAYFELKQDAALYLEYIWFIPPFMMLIAIGNLFLLHASNFHRIVVPTIFNELVPKAGIPFLVLAYFFDYVMFKFVFWGMLGLYIAMMFGQIWYVWRLGQLHLRPDFSLLKKPMLKEMANYSIYGFLGSLGSRFSSEFINIFMVGTLSTLSNTGIYVIAFFISNVIDVPRKAIARITAPLLADKWKENKLDEIQEIYHKTSLNQLIVGLWIFLAVWVSIDEIYEIMPNGESFVAGKYVVLILGIARVVDMMTGVNSEILSFSKYYRYNFYLILFMAVIHVSSNWILIPKLHIIGVAFATLLSLTLFNLVKFILLKWKLGMQPFTKETLFALAFALIAYAAASLLPSTGWAFVDAGLQSGLLTVLFGGMIWYFKISPDINQLVTSGLEKIRKR
jgi:O-antigen/teichoic acid export membrane protein